MKKVLSRLLNGSSWVICCLVLLLTVNSYVQTRVYGVTIPLFMGYGYATVETGSMEPNIPTNSFIIIKKTEEYQKGDVITYIDYRGLPITHRVVENSNGIMLVKGDANNVPDPPFSEGAVIGEVIYHIPSLGILINILKTPIVVLLLIVSLTVTILWDFIVKLLSRVRCASKRTNKESTFVKEE